MDLFKRPKPIEPAFTTPPTETPPAVAVEARIQEVDDKLRKELRDAADMRPFDGDTRARFNRLLDLRNAIRPARPKPRPRVPYTPGRPS